MIKYETSITYFDQCSKLLNRYEFKSPIHQKIWQLHCEGFSEREITKMVEEDKKTYKNGAQKSYKKSMIHNIIFELSSLIKRD